MSFWAYLLRCRDGSYYAGHSEDLAVRLGQHQRGETGGFTSTRRPVTLVWSQEFATREEALGAEMQVKGWSRAKKECLIRGDWQGLQVLAWGTKNPLPPHLRGGPSIPQGERPVGIRGEIQNPVRAELSKPPAHTSRTMKQVLIIGASRGIGLEFVRQYRADGAQVVATARSDEGLEAIRALGAKPLKLDVSDTASASGLAWQIDGQQFDTVVIVAGVYGPRHSGLQSPTASEFDAVMHTNVLGPMRVLPQLPDYLAPGAKLAILSSRMGSIGERSGGNGWLYRASKASANSVLKDASLLLAGKAICISFHPGWVRTDMGGEGADIDAATSVAGMRRVLAQARPDDNGSFHNYDGQAIGW